MKKYLLFFIPLGLIFLNSCKKDVSYLDAIGKSINNGSSGSGSTGSGTSGGTATDTYQPVTAGSYWKYRTGSDSSIYAMASGTSSFNGNTYYNVNATSNLYTGTQMGYYYPGTNHFYSQRSSSVIYGITIDMVYLNDVLAAGSTWKSKLTDNGLLNGVPAQTIGTIVETGISRTVLGKVYTNVIHTKVDLQYDLGTGFSSFGIYEFYVAKNIGIIENSAALPGFTSPPNYLYSYSIK